MNLSYSGITYYLSELSDASNDKYSRIVNHLFMN